MTRLRTISAVLRPRTTSLLIVLALLAGLPAALFAQPAAFTADDCATCHGGGDPSIPVVADSLLSHSVHAGLACTDCHGGVTELPHAEALPRVNCGQCHSDEAAMYTRHGRGVVGQTEDLPGCADCHGTHEIVASSEPASRVNKLNLPQTCGRCHRDLDLARKHNIQIVKPVELYESSVHGKATRGGVQMAATCIDCHSAAGTAHRILGPADAESSINHFNVPHTCGRCHPTIERDYWAGIHGQLTARGETDTPVCTHCHGEHGILRVSDPCSTVSPTQVAQATCSPCHEAAYLNEKYGIPAGRLASFVDSYHGLKSKAGDVTVANCASCHGSHKILPSRDPASSINPAHLRETCGQCHPAITKELASTRIHEIGLGQRPGWPRTIGAIYVVGIVIIIGFMVVHVLMDYRRHTFEVRRPPQVRRMDNEAIWMHVMLAVTFTVLALTGFALRYSEAWFFRHLFGWDGGAEVRGIIHRVSAVLFVICCFWHPAYLRTPRGRRFLRDMFPGLRDFGDFWKMVRYHVRRSPDRPHLGRFGYAEKAEYWALVWGSVVMVLTGFFLWFDNVAVRYFPRGVLEVMLVIHHYEAWLAVLAVAVWHFYWTIFNPDVYPGNPAWITGTVPAGWHPAEPDDRAPGGAGEVAAIAGVDTRE